MALSAAKPRKTKAPKAPPKPKAPKARASGGWKAKKSWGQGRGGGKNARGTTVEHTCGHKAKHAISGPKWKKERELARLAGRECRDCWATSRAIELEELCGISDLPEMEGTDAQVLWGRSIRAMSLMRLSTHVAVMDKARREVGLPPAADRYLAIALPSILGQVSSRWWIDNRETEDLSGELLSFDEIDALTAILREIEVVPVCPF